MEKTLIGSGSPTFCRNCGNVLQRAPGKGVGMFHFYIVEEKATGHRHRVHGNCLDRLLGEGGYKHVKEQ